MRIARTLLFGIFAILISQHLLAAEKYTISYFNVPPHVIFDAQTLTISGALYDFLNDEIAPAMGITFVWDKTPTNIPRQTQLLKDGERDAAALMAITPERSELFSLSETHYFESKPSIAVLRDHPLDAVTSVEDVLDLKVGYAAKTFITPFMRDERIRFSFIASPKAVGLSVKKLVHHRVQAAYAPDSASLLMELKGLETQYQDQVKVLRLPEPGSRNHIAFKKDLTELTERYNRAFIEVGGRDKYLEKLNRYLDSSLL